MELSSHLLRGNFSFCSYVHGSPLLENQNAFESREAAEKIAAALGRILMLDLVIRNEDRLPCRQLGWRGNYANLLLSEKVTSTNMDILDCPYDSAIKQYKPSVVSILQERRAAFVNCKLETRSPRLDSRKSDVSDVGESPTSTAKPAVDQHKNGLASCDFDIVAIDSGVPRRPPAGKRASDHSSYPKLVELLLNSSIYSSSLLYEITGGKLGFAEGDMRNDSHSDDMISVIQAFRGGFRDALRDLQGFHIFLLTLNQKLDGLLRSFMNILNRASSSEPDREDFVVPESPMYAGGHSHSLHPPAREHAVNDNCPDSNDAELQRSAHRQLSSGSRDNSDNSSPTSRESSLGKSSRWSTEPGRCLRLTSKLRDFIKCAKVCMLETHCYTACVALDQLIDIFTRNIISALTNKPS